MAETCGIGEETWNVLITFVPSVTVNQSQSSDTDRT
jgi:hypothetical protein